MNLNDLKMKKKNDAACFYTTILSIQENPYHVGLPCLGKSDQI
jgi:hypothetical protein